MTIETKTQNKVAKRDLSTAQKKADDLAVKEVYQLLENMVPFDETCDQRVLISLSTGFYSKGKDGINPQRAIEIGDNIQQQLDGNFTSAKI